MADIPEHNAKTILQKYWSSLDDAKIKEAVDLLDNSLSEIIDDCVNSSTKTYRYVLPTQLLAKLEVPSRDCRAVQEGANMPGRFDARSLCSQVIVPFDRENYNVLGGSGDPYVNNPLRIPAIVMSHAIAQRNRADFEKLCRILAYVEGHPDKLSHVMICVLSSIRKRLSQISIQYAIPSRLSLNSTRKLLDEFFLERSGGRRLQAVCVALFEEIGVRFGLYEKVNSGNINRADAASGDVADLDCLNEEGETVLSVEVKDRQLTLRDAENTLQSATQANVTEVLFLMRGTIAEADLDAYQDFCQKQFAVGHHVYDISFDGFLTPCLILFGETGRHGFFVRIGKCLDRFGELVDRQAWAKLLSTL